MSSNSTGKTCVFCKAYLFEEDDVVVCPICGAPHHRECYEKLGHCAEEELHGTENEYCRVKERAEKENAQENAKKEEQKQPFNEIVCPVCRTSYDKNLPACPNCSAQNAFMGQNFVMFNPLGHISPDHEIDEGVTAKDAMRFVFSNTHRYIPKFARLNKKKKVSWNWLAFFLPTGWFFSRKMFKAGFISGVFSVISTLCSIPLYNSLYALGVFPAETYMDYYNSLETVLPSINKGVLGLAFLGFVINILIRFISAIYGDYIYKKHAVSCIKIIKKSDDPEQGFRKLGGVNIFLFFLATMAVEYIPQFLSMFL